MGLKDQVTGNPIVSTALAVQKRYTADGADPLAAAIGFFAFLSLFPLMLLAIAAAGFVLDDPADQVALATAITDAIPGFGAAAEGGEGVQALIENVVEQRGNIGLIGALTLLLSGLRVVNAAMIATRVVFRGAVQSGVMAKVRQLLALIGLGALALGGVGASSIAGVGLGALPGPVAVVLSLGVTFLFDLVLFLGAYTLLSPTSSLSTRNQLPGAILAAIGWTGLKVAGASYVSSQVDSATAVYGALGGIIALLLLLYLAGRLYLYGAELTAVRHERVHGPLQPPVEEDAEATADDASTPAAAGGSAPRRDRDASSARRDHAPVEDGPPPVPAAARGRRAAAPGVHERAPSIQQRTHEQLARADAARGDVEVAPGTELQRALALGLAVAALAAGWRFLGGSSGS